MQTIEVMKDYQMCGFTLKKGTILTKVERHGRGSTMFEDSDGNQYQFDNSEIVFSKEFKKAFKVISKDNGDVVE